MVDKAAEQILKDEQNVRQHKPGAFDALMKDVLSVNPKDAARIFNQVKAEDEKMHQKTEIGLQGGHLIIDPLVIQSEAMDRLRKNDWTADQDAERIAKDFEQHNPRTGADLSAALSRVQSTTGDDRFLQVFVNQVNEILKKDGFKGRLELKKEEPHRRLPRTWTA